MQEIFMEIWNNLNNLLVPAIVAGGTYLIALTKKYAKRYFDGLEVKRELENLAKTTEIKNTILREIETVVSSVVGSNMQIADSIKKENGGTLTDEQSEKIRTTVKEVIMASLPVSLTDKEGVLMKVVGGQEQLDRIIDNMIEKHVYDYKIRKVGEH